MSKVILGGAARAVAAEVLGAAITGAATTAASAARSALQAGAAKASGAKATQGAKAPAAAKPAAKTTSKTTVKSTAVAPAKTGYASASATGEYAFLKDASLSVEEKLLLFLALQKKNTEGEIEKLLDKAAEEKAKAATKKSGGGLLGGVTKVFDVVKSSVPGLATIDKLTGGKLDDLLKQVPGPLLAAAATAAGLPMLAPVALQLGPTIAGAVLDAKVSGGGSSASSSASTSTGKDEPGKLDAVDTARIQLLQSRMQEWTALLSNLMSSFHQTRMSVIQNLR